MITRRRTRTSRTTLHHSHRPRADRAPLNRFGIEASRVPSSDSISSAVRDGVPAVRFAEDFRRICGQTPGKAEN